MTLKPNNPGKDLKVRYWYLGGAMLAGFLLLIIRLYRLQITQHDEYAAKSVANFVKEVRLRADRGMILDSRVETGNTGDILVKNRPSFDVFVTPAFCQKCGEEVLPRLATWLGWDATQLESLTAQIKSARRTAPFQAIPVRVDISRDQLDTLEAHRTELPGVEPTPVQHRNYIEGAVLAHVLGYMNEITQDELDRLNAAGATYSLGDYVGRRGVERYFESTLRGVDGYRKEVVNARGETIPELDKPFLGGDQVIPSKSGNNVVLSIDMRLQEEAERTFPGVAGAVVAVDVRTGFILAMVSRPGFDPNKLTGRVTGAEMLALSKDPLQPMIFRPAQQHYSPGSTFKAFTVLAALRSHSFTPQTTVVCTGGYRLGPRVWRCYKTHGPVQARAALKESCDMYMYKVADTLGLDPIAEMGKAFGFGTSTGIGVVAEVPGIMPDSVYHNRVTPGGYTKGMALNSAIGQGDDNVTPLQLAMAYAALGNGGTLYQPQLVRRIESEDGVTQFEPRVVRKLDLNLDDLKVVVEGLTAVVNEPGGTAYRTAVQNLRLNAKGQPEIRVAGKTGTAQVARIGTVRLKEWQMDYFQRDNAWFSSFAPAENPEIAVIVLNEHGGHGGLDAAPTAMHVIQKYFDLKKQDADAAAPSATVPRAGEPAPALVPPPPPLPHPSDDALDEPPPPPEVETPPDSAHRAGRNGPTPPR